MYDQTSYNRKTKEHEINKQ